MFAVSDTGRRLSPSRLATYGTCPRQYEYDKVWRVETPDESRRYLDRGLIYHAAIEETCNAVRASTDTMSDDDIRQFALEAVNQEWNDRAKRSEYQSDAQFAYDHALTVSAVESFFETDGIEHARNSVATEETVTCEHEGRRLKGRVDNIVRTDEGLHVYDYKGSFGNIISSWSSDSIPEHLDGEEFIPGKLKSLFQAAIYIEGAKNLDVYEPGMEVGFSFYALMKNKSRTGHPDGLQVSASGYPREVTDVYEEYHDDIWTLVERCYDGIIEEQFEPARFEEIQEDVCGDCDYRAMCGDYLSAEVRIDE